MRLPPTLGKKNLRLWDPPQGPPREKKGPFTNKQKKKKPFWEPTFPWFWGQNRAIYFRMLRAGAGGGAQIEMGGVPGAQPGGGKEGGGGPGGGGGGTTKRAAQKKLGENKNMLGKENSGGENPGPPDARETLFGGLSGQKGGMGAVFGGAPRAGP